MMEQVHEMEENIRRAKKGDFKVSIHKMEVRFVITYNFHNIELYNLESTP